jgi:hypothetical protein
MVIEISSRVAIEKWRSFVHCCKSQLLGGTRKTNWSAQFVGGCKRCKWNPDVRMNVGATCQKRARSWEQAAWIASCFVNRSMKQGEKKTI